MPIIMMIDDEPSVVDYIRRINGSYCGKGNLIAKQLIITRPNARALSYQGDTLERSEKLLVRYIRLVKPDVLLLDVNFEKITSIRAAGVHGNYGVRLLQRLRKEGYEGKVAFFTAYDVVKADVKVDGIIEKSTSFPDFLKAISELLNDS